MNSGLPAVTARESDSSPRSPEVTGAVIGARGLRKVYRGGDGSELVVLNQVDLTIAAAEAVAIVGASGAGKSTLLHLLGGLDHPTAGEVTVGGRVLTEYSEEDLARLRNTRIGFVFQFHHLLREFSAIENVMMPQRIAGVPEREARERARALLEEVGLGGRLEHHSTELSGGEQQRVAVARALSNRPLVVIADEPSGNLDAQTSDRLHDLLFRLRDEHGVSIVLATHNRELADRTDRVLQLEDGEVSDFYSARD